MRISCSPRLFLKATKVLYHQLVTLTILSTITYFRKACPARRTAPSSQRSTTRSRASFRPYRQFPPKVRTLSVSAPSARAQTMVENLGHALAHAAHQPSIVLPKPNYIYLILGRNNWLGNLERNPRNFSPLFSFMYMSLLTNFRRTCNT